MKLRSPAAGQYRLLLHFLRSHWSQGLLAFLLDLSASVCLVIGSLLLAQAIAVIVGFRSVRGSLLGLHLLDSTQLLVGFGIVTLVRWGLDWARWRLQGVLAEDFAHYLRQLIFAHLLRTDYQHAQQQGVGRHLLRFSGDLSSVQQLLTRGVLRCSSDFILLVLGWGLIAAVELRLAACIVVALAGAAVVSRVLQKKIRRVEERRRSKKSSLITLLNTTLWYLPGIQALNRSTRVHQQFEQKARSLHLAGHRYQRKIAAQKALPVFFTHLLLLLVLVGGGCLGVSGVPLFAVVLVLSAWRGPLSRLLRAGWVWEKGALSLQKIEVVLQAPASSGGQAALPARSCRTLQLHNVSLRLHGQLVLDRLSLQLETGQIRRLQMPTGGGKTTLVKLLAGLYQPDAGHLEWDAQPGAQLQLHSIRQQLALVSPAFPLVGATLIEALSPSGRTAALASTERALVRFQRLFPEVLGGLAGSRPLLKGCPVSAGQQRLLQCLRAVLANKPFLILDDPFVGLHPAVASRLYQYVREHSAHKGVLLLETHPLHIEAAP